MIDIAKCNNEKCPLKHECYRYVSEADKYRQSYSDFNFSVNEHQISCDYQIKIGLSKNGFSNGLVL